MVRTLVTAMAVAAAANFICTGAMAEVGIDPEQYCEQYGCRKGHSFLGPPLVSGPWIPFDSDDPLVWGADACLGFFLTRDASAWNGGAADEPDEYGLYVTLGDRKARIHVFNWPRFEGRFAGYGVFRCENTSSPGHPAASADRAELLRWIETRLPKSAGWTGEIGDWNAWPVAVFSNKALELTVAISNIEGNMRIQFAASYFGPHVRYH